MILSDARAQKGLRRVKTLDLDGVKDPREHGRYGHIPLVRLLVFALAVGRRTLRAVESLGDDLSQATLCALGLQRAPSDTLVYRLLAEQSLVGWAQVLVRQVKDALLHKDIENDLFAMGVVSIDGKSVWSGMFAADPNCRDQKSDGLPSFVLMSQRACLTSSSARPVVTQTLIPKHAGEADTFATTFSFLIRHFRRSFEVITYDAGGTSRRNAELVNAANKAYVFAIKGNQPTVHLAAQTRLGNKDGLDDAEQVFEVFSEERVDGGMLRREVVRCPVQADDPDINFPTARQLWRCRQTHTKTLPGGTVERIIEDRYFITNRVFSAPQALALVRLHWGIENGPNWTMDMQLGEDDGTPCRNGRGVAVTSWLRLLAYNLLSMWRRKLPPRRDEGITPWARAMSSLLYALQLNPTSVVTPV